jgi:hypothetical protein
MSERPDAGILCVSPVDGEAGRDRRRDIWMLLLDGRRFLSRELVAEQADPRPLCVLVNWPTALERR